MVESARTPERMSATRRISHAQEIEAAAATNCARVGCAWYIVDRCAANSSSVNVAEQTSAGSARSPSLSSYACTDVMYAEACEAREAGLGTAAEADGAGVIGGALGAAVATDAEAGGSLPAASALSVQAAAESTAHASNAAMPTRLRIRTLLAHHR